MELTCLGLGRDQGKWAGPSCHLLNVAGAHLLLECPLDLSMLHHFFPAANIIKHTQDADPRDAQCSQSAASQMGALQTGSRKRALRDMEDNNSWFDVEEMHARHTQTSSDAHIDAYARRREAENSGFPHGLHVQSAANTSLGFTRIVNGYTFLDVEPWYKTAECGLFDVSSIDAVLVSNPKGMLGLPFLTRTTGFSGKIYATSVTSKLGQLMMEELVYMHAEYIQSFGRSDSSKKPSWLDVTALDALPVLLKKALVDDDGVGRANWQSLYRKEDIDNCMKQVQCLHYDEEINIYDCFCIKPCSSGSELGASNWVISGARRFSYFSASDLSSGHSMALNVISHVTSDALLFCDLKRSIVNDNAEASYLGRLSQDTQAAQHNKPSRADGGRHVVFHENIVDDLSLVCKAVLDAIVSGGSVLVSMSNIGAMLEALEVISQTLGASNLHNIPLFFISPVAEEILVYANTIPEWLCAARQEKLYAGEALFGHVELLQQNRLHHLSTVYSQKAVKQWREPCVVFVLDWGFRMGPAVPLMQKWRQDRRCLLVLSQSLVDAKLALTPFMPLNMRLLLYNRGGKLGEAEVSAIVEKLTPDLSMVPETMRLEFEQFSEKNAISVGNMGFYDMWDVLTIPAPQRIEADMAAEVACQVHPKQLDSGIALSHTTMRVHQKEGKWLLDLPVSSKDREAFVSRVEEDICWGTVEVADLVNNLKERGLCCEVRPLQTLDDTNGSNLCIVVSSPAPAKVELRLHAATLIETDNPGIRQLITDAVKSLLHVV